MPFFRFTLSLMLLVLLFSTALPAGADTVLVVHDGLKKNLTVKDLAKYDQMKIEYAEKIVGAFGKQAPDDLGVIKDALTLILVWEELSNYKSDPKAILRTLKVLGDWGLGEGVNRLEKYALKKGLLRSAFTPVLGAFALYMDSLAFINDQLFLPWLVDDEYRGYKQVRDGGTSHAEYWDSRVHVPEALVANVITEVILKKHGVEPGYFEGIKFDKETLATLEKSASEPAAGRTVTVRHKPGLTFSGGRRFALEWDISKTIDVTVGSVKDYRDFIVDVRNAITKRDLELRAKRQEQLDAKAEGRTFDPKSDVTGYRPLSAQDGKDVGKALFHAFEKLDKVRMGHKIHAEALAYIGKMLQLRYEQEVAVKAMKASAREAQKILAAKLEELAAYNWPHLVTVRVVNPDGTPGDPIPSAAFRVDGRLCSTETNGGKPCGSNRFGLAGLHLLRGGHDVTATAPGYKPATIRIYADTPPAKGAPPMEHEILLPPDAPVALAVTLTAGDGGAPLAGAALQLRPETGPALTATTGPDGKTAFAQVLAGGSYTLTATAPGYAPGEWADIVADETGFEGYLKPLLSIAEIKALGPDGHPLPMATVAFAGQKVFTDQNGVARFEGVLPGPVGGYPFSATAKNLPETRGMLTVAPVRDGQIFTASVQLKVSGAILVVVRDQANRVPAGTRVTVAGPDGDKVHSLPANGMLRLQDLKPGGYYINANAAGYQSGEDVEVMVTATKPMHKIRLALSAGMKLKVLAVDENQNTLRSTIALDRGPFMNAPTGSATFDSVTPGTHVITVKTADGQSATANYTADPAKKSMDTLTVLVKSGGAISVRVGSTDGKPVVAQITLTHEGSVVHKATGGSATFTGLAPGTYQVLATAQGYEPATPQPVTLPKPGIKGSVPVSLTLTPESAGGTTIVLKVVDEQGTPVSAKVLALSRNAGPLGPAISDFFSGSSHRFDNLPQGSYQGSVEVPGYKVVRADTISLPGPQTVNVLNVVVRKVDAPSPSVHFTYSSRRDEGPNRTFFNVRMGGRFVADDGKTANVFCQAQGLPAAHPQPGANYTNFQGIVLGSDGTVFCKTKKYGGTASTCRALKDISCLRPPPPDAGAPCDPNDPLCGLDQDL